MFSIGAATNALLNGSKVSRSSWKYTDKFLVLVQYSNCATAEHNLHYHLHQSDAKGTKWIGVVVDGCITPWNASQQDLLATDYFVVE